MRNLLFLLTLCLSFHSKAALIVWEFEVEIIEFEDELNLFSGFEVGDTFTGYFGYDDSLQQTNTSTYINDFASDSLIFGLDFLTGINDIVWDEGEVSVAHQGGRDIIDFVMEYDSGDYEAELELGYVDYSNPFDQGELPLSWHDLSSYVNTPEFEIYVDDNILGLSTEIYAEFTSISLREVTSVPAPAAIWFILPFALLALRKRRIGG